MSEAEREQASPGVGTPLRVASAIELAAVVGREFAPSRWLAVTQDEIDRFVALTGDRNWIHTDVARTARELPGAKTVVPGQLLLALVPGLLQETYQVTGSEQGQAATLRNVRFRHAVHSGDTFRLRARLTLVKQRQRFVQVDTMCDLELASGRKALTSQRTDVFLTE
ncbi:MAG: MaoC/PaaZ C-terminal domain-containing protein [Xanthobacteraceae bacterium]